MTTLTRDPSARRASTIGLSSSTRRPSGARIRSIASRSARSDEKRTSRSLDSPAPLDVDPLRPVHHHLLDRGIRQQLLERAEAHRVAKDQLTHLGTPGIREHRGVVVHQLGRPPARDRRRGAAGHRVGPAALHQTPPQVRGERLGMAIGDAHAERTPRRPGSPRPDRAVGAARLASVAEIEVRQADVTKLEVDAIANAANTELRHGGGVAAAIVRAGGRVIQDESDELSPIGLGEAVATSAGEMPARWVIHAATMELGGPTSAEVIRSATASTLAKAEEVGARSLALVAFGTGVGGFPLADAARIEVEEVRRHLDERGALELVVFAVFGADARRAFEEAVAASGRG